MWWRKCEEGRESVKIKCGAKESKRMRERQSKRMRERERETVIRRDRGITHRKGVSFKIILSSHCQPLVAVA